MRLQSGAALAGILVVAATIFTSCGQGQPAPKVARAAVESPREIASPAGEHSGQGNLASGPAGEVYLSWMETPESGSPALKFAVLKDGKWSQPRTIVENENLMVNYADFPSLLPMGNGVLAAHWLSNIPGDDEAYGIKLSFSRDDGKTWSKPLAPNRDRAKTEHGFVSLVANPNGDLGVVWLDSRKLAGPGKSNDVALMYTTVSVDGKLGPETTIQGRVCECCQPVARRTPTGILLVYRGRTADEIRDITTVRFDGTEWSDPKTVFADGWKINGCPINGPSMALEGNRVAVAWFTGASDKRKVEIAFSSDGGESFGPPAQVDDGKPMGRVSVVLQDSGSALVTWLESGDKGAELRGRRVDASGSSHPSFVVGTTEAADAAGFPRAVRNGNNILFAWTDSLAGKVRVAELESK